MAEWAGSNPRPFFEVHFTTTICTLQSKQAILTVSVARTELPQQGQIYFRVLDAKTIARLCAVLDCQPGDLMEYVKE